MRFSPYDWKSGDLIAGDVAVDFVNTASKWREEPIDRLGGLAGFADWARLAGLLTAEAAAALKTGAAARPGEAAAVFDNATALRHALWRIFDAAAHGGLADAKDLGALKGWTRRAAQHLELEQTGAGFRERWAPGAPVFETPLFEIALAAEKLLKEGRLDRLHVCNGDGCGWLFLDTSRNGARRWCSMSTCGNDAKVKKFRKRKNAKTSR